MLLASGSENGRLPTNPCVVEQGSQTVVGPTTRHMKSQLRLGSTPSHVVPALSRRFILHNLSPFITRLRPSGLAQGNIQISSVSIMIRTSVLDHEAPPYARPFELLYAATRSVASSTIASGFINSRACIPPTIRIPRRFVPPPARRRKARIC